MEVVDVRKEMLEKVELLGMTGYFTELRVDKETVPEGMHCYELRHGDDDGFPVSVEESVRVNYFGAVILTEVLELREEKALQFGYEDFTFTGDQMYLSQVQGKEHEEQRDAEGYETIPTGAGLISFMEEHGISFQMNEQEADLLCGYIDGHGYAIGQKDGKLCCGDLCAETDRTVWEETTIDELVDAAMKWNYGLLQEAKADMENPDNFTDFVNKHSRYMDLRADEKVLDTMFDRTKFGEQIGRVADALADEFVWNLQKGDINRAVKEFVQGINSAKKAIAAQKPEQKKERVR